MNRFEIQDDIKLKYKGAQDDYGITAAVECSKRGLSPYTVALKWRWLAVEMIDMYADEYTEGLASLLRVWVDGFIEGTQIERGLSCGK